MQPNSASQQYPPPGYQGGETATRDGRPGFVTPPAQAAVTRVRPWAVALTAGLAMAVLIAAIGNSKVSDAILRHLVGNDYNPNSFWDNALRSLTTFAWRFSPRGDEDFGRVWISGVLFVLVTVVLTYLFTLALARGKRGFGGSFFATWTAVVFAVVIASYVRAATADLKQLTGQDQSKPVAVFFSQYSPAQLSVFAGLLFGLAAALLAGLVGALSNTTTYFVDPASVRPPFDPTAQDRPSAESAAPQEREVWAAPPPPGPISSPSPWTTPERDERADLSKHDDGPQPTAVLPAVGAQDDPAARQSEHDAQATTQFPSYGSSTQHGSQQRDEPARDTTEEPESTQAYRVPAEDRPQDEGDSTQAYRVRPEDERDR